jgi:hypothetical protein
MVNLSRMGWARNVACIDGKENWREVKRRVESDIKLSHREMRFEGVN